MKKDPTAFRERFKAWKEGKDPYRYLYDNQSGNWNRITDDENADAFANFVATSNGSRPTFSMYENTPNPTLPVSKNESVVPDNTLWTRQQVEKANNTRTWRSDAADVMHAIGEGAMLASTFAAPEVEPLVYPAYQMAKQAVINGIRSRVSPAIISSAINTAVKENAVITAYNRNPLTKDIGSLWDYQTYLDNVFPNSKVKNILWHGSKVKGLQSFSTDAIGSNMPIKGSVGMYLAPEKTTAASYGSKGDIYPVLLNSENPFITNQFFGGISSNGVNITKISPKIRNTVLAQNDAVIAPARGEVAFFEPDNALILGSNRDLERFKSFMYQATK